MEHYIKINHRQHTEVTREADNSENKWDSDDLSHSHLFDGYVDGSDKYWDFILTENHNKKDLYLVYVLHTSGDSFHYEDGCLCMVSLVDKYEDAVKIRDAIKKDEDIRNKSEWKSHSLEVVLSTGKIEKIYCGTWQGYFESYQSVNIQTLEFKKS